MDKNNSLSMAKFKKVNGELVDPSTLSSEDKLDFYLANLMKKVINTLELSIMNDRVFNTAKYQVMADFYAARENLGEK